ncbi:DNA topoisomerase 3 [BD1-7 clade bacterium]|uniref:DNA topoisomerase n=1 Tax=BD1-7 clade bacterium TaxID=2029982 RepID=A0A5S9N0D0_9GAMM|nr:DNA topoisomerase 3 [BD1-7 clade bacterium]
MRLFIAEKPSMGRAIADALPKPIQRKDGYIVAGNGDTVSWCIGHLLEQAEPDAYDPHYKKWRLEDLPIVPTQWKLRPKPKTRKQLNVLKALIPKATEIVHAGDPDREGQLLVDEVIDFLHPPSHIKRDAKRLLISDLNPAAIRTALDKLHSNRDFIPLSVSALARTRADWLYGMNMTRMCTLFGQGQGYQGVLSVGRVQTPVLGLVVERDRQIEAFQPHPFYEVWAQVKTTKNENFEARWLPSETCDPWRDDEGRMLSRPLCENVIRRISGKEGQVVKAGDKVGQQGPPLPYNLSSLQIDASKRFGMSAKQVLDTCQALYEKHKLITYPRSDCRYLPEAHHREATAITSAIPAFATDLARAAQDADTKQRSKAWNDKKVSAHHAIIPTAKTSASHLSREETGVYTLIARQYLLQFYPAWKYSDREILLTIEGGEFQAKSRQTLDAGWKKLLEDPNYGGRARKVDAQTDGASAENDSASQRLPALTVGESVDCTGARLLEKQTHPPKPFTTATLLAAMTGIARFVANPEIKKVLKETDGIGTEATRAQIIELLFDRGFLVYQGKQIRSTETGRALISSLPELAASADLTAHWEAKLGGMAERQVKYNEFMQAMKVELGEVMGQVQSSAFSHLRGKGTASFRKRKKSGTGNKSGSTAAAKKTSTRSKKR